MIFAVLGAVSAFVAVAAGAFGAHALRARLTPVGRMLAESPAAPRAALPPEVDFRFRGLGHMVGNTPLLPIESTYRGEPRVIYAKAENLNLTGSIKDRMALHILRQGYARGLLQPGAPIVEATSGNTGISFSAVGRALGHPVVIFLPNWMSRERIDLIRSFGATIHLVSKEEAGRLL